MHDRFVSMHSLTTFAGVLLNRDENQQPKDLVYGGTIRTRVSSQCWRRADRQYLRDHAESGPLAGCALGDRTRELALLTASALQDEHGWDHAEAIRMARLILGSLGLKFGEKKTTADLTKVMIFARAGAGEDLGDIINRHRSDLQPWQEREIKRLDKADADKAKRSPRGRRNSMSSAPSDAESGEARPAEGGSEPTETKTALPGEVKAEILKVLDPSAVLDIALFGRMLAEIAESPNVDGALQAAHAFTVEAATVVDDYFTAVDDVKQSRRDAFEAMQEIDHGGAGMTGYQSLTSGTFYRCVILDRQLLRDNLSRGGFTAEEKETAAHAAEHAYLDAFCHAVPAAKRTSTAAPGVLPKLVLVAQGPRPANYAGVFEAALADSGGDPVSIQAARRLLRQHQMTAGRYPGTSPGRLLINDLDIQAAVRDLTEAGGMPWPEEVDTADALLGGSR